MKKLLSYIIILLVFSSFASDDFCYKYFPAKPGVVYEMTSYNAKDKMVSISEGTILEAQKTDAGFMVKVGTKVFDEKRKEIMSGDYVAKCENDKFYMDMSNIVPQEMLAGMQDMEMEMTGGFMEFPTNPEAGQQLPDADMTLKFMSGGATIMTLTANITDRKVEGFETVTTPAGTFNCVKFSETMNMKMLFKFTAKSITWMAEDVGVVKSESYNEKGKLEGYSLMTKLTR
jgi:hypothetical protein